MIYAIGINSLYWFSSLCALVFYFVFLPLIAPYMILLNSILGVSIAHETVRHIYLRDHIYGR